MVGVIPQTWNKKTHWTVWLYYGWKGLHSLCLLTIDLHCFSLMTGSHCFHCSGSHPAYYPCSVIWIILAVICHCRMAPFQSAKWGSCTPGSSASVCQYGSSSALSATHIASGGASAPTTYTQGGTRNWTQNLTLHQTCDTPKGKKAGCLATPLVRLDTHWR